MSCCCFCFYWLLLLYLLLLCVMLLCLLLLWCSSCCYCSTSPILCLAIACYIQWLAVSVHPYCCACY
jgi:hypothetical protein